MICKKCGRIYFDVCFEPHEPPKTENYYYFRKEQDEYRAMYESAHDKGFHQYCPEEQ